MDIYKLTDDLTKKHKRDIMEVEASEDAGVSDYKITGMREGVRNPERVNVYVNNKYAFSLDISQVVELGVKVGRVISSAELEEFKKASEFGKMYQRALEWVLMRPRSTKECRDYLYKKIYEKKLDKKYIDLIIEKLQAKKYLDDRRFAEYYVENRFVKKGVSEKRLRMELMKKGVSKDVVDEVMAGSERNDREEILKIIVKKRNRYDDEKLVAYLCRQGFSYQLSKELVEESSSDSMDE
ncbi:RecX family transcriptional regulator [Candidatus Saccharibacteria bacterium]|nr:RecX family transcriptional regulator [Candidatus Saccharibacteria bacterium]